jgi:hypothetical protein
LKRLYHKLFLSGQNLSQALAEARGEFAGASATLMLDFIAASRRGVCRPRGGKNRDSAIDSPAPTGTTSENF